MLLVFVCVGGQFVCLCVFAASLIAAAICISNNLPSARSNAAEPITAERQVQIN